MKGCENAGTKVTIFHENTTKTVSVSTRLTVFVKITDVKKLLTT